jgi:hypothetical protein
LALSHDLAVGADLPGGSPGTSLVAKTIKVGVGSSVSGAVGLAKGTASAMVHIYFSRVAKKLGLAAQTAAEQDMPLYLVEEDPAEANLAFAKSSDRLLELSAKRGGDGRSALYRLDREKFRKGIAKAIWVGKFFGRRAEKHQKSAWKLKQIKSSFDVSISGTVGLATISGMATAEIAFENKNF